MKAREGKKRKLKDKKEKKVLDICKIIGVKGLK
jgi:hypothetical protein